MQAVRADIEFSVVPTEWGICLGTRRIGELLRDLGMPATGALAESFGLELVRNAATYAKGWPRVRVTVADQVRVEVTDSLPQHIEPTDTGGLRDLAENADAWGCDLTETGKTVWFELSWRGRD